MDIQNWIPVLDGGLPAFVPVIKISGVSKDKLAEAQKIKDYIPLEQNILKLKIYWVKLKLILLACVVGPSTYT